MSFRVFTFCLTRLHLYNEERHSSFKHAWNRSIVCIVYTWIAYMYPNHVIYSVSVWMRRYMFVSTHTFLVCFLILVAQKVQIPKLVLVHDWVLWLTFAKSKKRFTNSCVFFVTFHTTRRRTALWEIEDTLSIGIFIAWAELKSWKQSRIIYFSS